MKPHVEEIKPIIAGFMLFTLILATALIEAI